MFHGGANHPFIGGGHGPNFASGVMETADEFAHDRKDLARERAVKIFRGRAHHHRFGDALVHRDHFTAHPVFRHVAGAVVEIAGAHGEFDSLAYDIFLLELPVEEAFPNITRPEGAVAIECGDARGEFEDGVKKWSHWRTDRRRTDRRRTD